MAQDLKIFSTSLKYHMHSIVILLWLLIAKDWRCDMFKYCRWSHKRGAKTTPKSHCEENLFPDCYNRRSVKQSYQACQPAIITPSNVAVVYHLGNETCSIPFPTEMPKMMRRPDLMLGHVCSSKKPSSRNVSWLMLLQGLSTPDHHSFSSFLSRSEAAT